MSFKFRKGKKPGREARRILRLETEKALVHLDQFEQDPAIHVHKARRAFRRIRALLRLVRQSDPYVYSVENKFFRELGRSLSAARDQDAALEITRYLQDNQPSGSRSESLFLLRRLIQEASSHRTSVDPIELQRRIFVSTEELEAAKRRYAHLSFDMLTHKKLRKSVDRTMRHVRQSYRNASASDISSDLHELRKRVRCALIQLTMCAPIEPAYTSRLRAQMRTLEKLLGKHQDLCIVQALISGRRDTTYVDNSLLHLTSLVESEKQNLRQQVLAEGRSMLAGAEEARLMIVRSDSARHSA